MTPIFGLVVNLFLMGIAIWSISETLVNKKFYLGEVKTTITTKGIRIIVCALGVVFFSYWKDSNYENSQKLEKEVSRQKDSSNKEDIVKAVADNSEKIAKALAEYGLKIIKNSDSSLQVIRDSIKNVNKPTPEPDPRYTLYLTNLGEPRKSIEVKEVGYNTDSVYVKFAAYQNDVHDLTYYSFIMFPFKGDTIILQNLVDKNIDVMINEVVSIDLVTHNPLHLLDVFWLKYIGIYKNKQGKKLYLDETYILRPKTGEYQRVSGADVDNWKEFIIKKRSVAKLFYEKKIL